MARTTFRVKFEVQNVRDGLVGLRNVPEAIRRKTMIKAMRTGARVLVKGMRKGLRRHKRTGALSASIKTNVKYYAKRNVMVVVVGVSSGARGTFRGEQTTPWRYSHFVTNPRRAFTQECPRNSGRFRRIGANTPDDYVSEASVSGRSEVVAAMRRIVDEAVG